MADDDWWTEQQYKQIISHEWNKRFLSDLGPVGGCLGVLSMLAAIVFITIYVFSGQLEPPSQVTEPVPRQVEPRNDTVRPTPAKTIEHETVLKLNFDDIAACAYSVGKSQRFVDQLRSGTHWKNDNVDRHLNAMDHLSYDANYGGLKGLKGTERDVYKKAFRAGYLDERQS